MLTETSIQVNGSNLNLMDSVFIHIKKELPMKDSGKMDSSMEKEWKSGQMVVHIKENM